MPRASRASLASRVPRVLSAVEETHYAVGELSQLLSELAPHITHKPALADLARALVLFLERLPTVRGELLMREEEVMLRAIARANHEAELAEAEELGGEGDIDGIGHGATTAGGGATIDTR